MIRARHHMVIYPMFKWLTRLLVRRNFSSVEVHADFDDQGGGVLVLANHISWWDGFWMELLNQKLLRRRLHFMMLHEQLKKHWYFQYAGGYSVRKGTREVVESIRYTNELLCSGANMVLMFPQGQIHSAYCDFIHFEKGAERIVGRSATELQVLFVANFIDYYSNAKPTLFIYAKSYSSSSLKDKNLEQEYNQFYNRVLNQHKAKIS